MISPTILFDVWEGSLEINEDILISNNVSGLIIRINDMNGGHHLDENFFNQYSQSINAGLATGVYFVYNPWVNGATNYMWLSANIPTLVRALFVDIEVKYSGINSTVYAQEVRKFIDLCKQRWNTAIYTGQWFLSYLAYWPTDVPYWWAQYPNSLYPSSTQYWSYEQLRSTLLPLSVPYNASLIPGRLLIWQCSGDRIVLPGSLRPIDINVFYGSTQELNNWFGITPTSQETLIKSEQWYNGCLYEQIDVNTNHGVVHTHLLTFDADKVQEFFVTPRPVTRHYVPAWLEMFPEMDIAVNCDQFVGIDMGGYNVSHGQPYGPQGAEDTVYIDQQNHFLLNTPTALLWNAYAVPNVLARDGTTLQHIRDINALKGCRPRVASGISRYNTKTYLLAVDGDETYDITTESGFDFVETSEFLLKHGAWEVYMHDGGGSETLSKRQSDGNVIVVNDARGEDYQAKWNSNLRRVANCLMVKMKTEPIPPQEFKGILTLEDYEPLEITLEV